MLRRNTLPTKLTCPTQRAGPTVAVSETLPEKELLRYAREGDALEAGAAVRIVSVTFNA